MDTAKIDMWKLLGYAMTQMHDHVVRRNKRYTLLWVTLGDHRLWPWQVMNVYRNIHQRYVDNLDAIHIVHPSWTVIGLRLLVLWPLERFLPKDFWDRFHSHDRIEFLDMAGFDLKKLDLPQDLIQFDKELDVRAEEQMRMASDMMGGPASTGLSGSSFGNAASAYERSGWDSTGNAYQ